MSTSISTKKPEAGLGDTYERVIIGDNISKLKSVEDLPDETSGPGNGEGEEATASTEDLHLTIDKEDNGVKAEDEGKGCAQHGGVPRPMVSRVIDAEGHARITILLGFFERNFHDGVITGLIDAATENDVVDITIVSRPGAKESTIEMRSILSAVGRCKAHVITRAGALTTFGEVALWLSGDERRMSKMGCIFVRQPVTGFVGDVRDYAARAKAAEQSMKEYIDYIAAAGLFTKEELKKAIDDRSVLTLYHDELFERMKTLKNVD